MSIEALAFAKQLDLGANESAQARLLIYVIAENTFNDSFVCRLCQEQLAYEAGRATDRTIRRHLDALEAARIIIRKRSRDDNGNFLAHVIRLVGFKRWYARDHAAPKKRYRSQSPPAKLSGGEGPPDTPPKRLPPPDKMSSGPPDKLSAGPPDKLSGHHRTLLSGTYKDNRTSKTLRSPPTPSSDPKPDVPAEHGGGISNGSAQAVPPDIPVVANSGPTGVAPSEVSPRGPTTTERLLSTLRADGEAIHVVDAFIAPLLETRAFKRDIAGDTAKLAQLRELRDGLAPRGQAWLEAALPRVRAARMTMPNLAEALHALGSGGDHVTPSEGVRSTVDAYRGPRTHWPVLQVYAGDPGWEAWLEAIGHRMGTAAVEVAIRAGRIEAAARWPADGLPNPKVAEEVEA